MPTLNHNVGLSGLTSPTFNHIVTFWLAQGPQADKDNLPRAQNPEQMPDSFRSKLNSLLHTYMLHLYLHRYVCKHIEERLEGNIS